VHPIAFIASHPDCSMGYLDRELGPWLRHLKESSQMVSDLYRNNPGFGNARLQEGDAKFTSMSHTTCSEKMVLNDTA
jgi:hypothetical protein